MSRIGIEKESCDPISQINELSKVEYDIRLVADGRVGMSIKTNQRIGSSSKSLVFDSMRYTVPILMLLSRQYILPFGRLLREFERLTLARE